MQMRAKQCWVVVLGLCAGCGAARAPVAAPPAASVRTEAAPVAPSTLDAPASMQIHFAYATVARDAVISGRLDQVRPFLLALAAEQPSSDVPSDWLPWLRDMQDTARTGAGATSLEAAASSVAALANDCGECHRTTAGGQGDAAHHAPKYDPADKKGLAEKMARHHFAADALWLGLTGPEHQAWATGAAALMNITVPALVDERGKPATQDRRPSGEGSLQGRADPRLPGQDQDNRFGARADSVDLDVALRKLRELGTRADQAKTAQTKQEVFAELIARCGECHAALGLRLPLGGANSERLTAAPNAKRKRVVISADKIVITEKIQFDFEAATIRPESHGLLDEITAVIQSNPQLRKISIEGHTDTDGAAEYNLKLSRDRAAAVQRYLTQHGVEPARLTSTGFGEEQPIASNDAAEGKEANRRVELRILEQTAAERSYEVDPTTGGTRPR